MSTLITKLNSVVDEPTFLAFLSALEADRRTNPSEWQCSSIEDFLEAAVRWAEDTKNGVNDYVVPENPWKRFAEMIYCGKVYE